jgi:rubrerythrin
VPHHRITTALSLALASGLALGACHRTPRVAPGEDAMPSEPGAIGPVESAPPVSEVPATPTDPSSLCTVDSLLDKLVPAQEVDTLIVRTAFRPTSTAGPGQDIAQIGEACATAADPPACMSELASTSPEGSGWGYCGMGCSDSGLVTTRGQSVDLYDSPAEIAAFLGDIDVPAEALLLAIANDYSPVCDSPKQEGDVWMVTASILTSDCPMTRELRALSIDGTGTVTVLETIETTGSNICAGRRPDGMVATEWVCDDAVAQHLAALAHLEAAAVIAFERLAVDLEHLGAPEQLVRRARAAASDEVDHAERMGAMAGQHGAVVPAVEVAEHVIRSMFDIALENAVEGCVRETYGVVDALYRSQQATNSEVRGLFSKIAKDEARHAALSWDVAEWLEQHLSAVERAEIALAAKRAHASLRNALGRGSVDAVQRELGAPPSQAAVAMADSLQRQLS